MAAVPISRKSIGTLVDELITTSMKCWHMQELVMEESEDRIVAAAAKSAQKLNARRNLLINAIDERFDEANISPTEKTYDRSNTPR